jgi:hypothetical protein
MATTEDKSLIFDQEFDLDKSLYPSGLDWTFNKPKGVAYVCVYIIKKEEEEKEEVCDECFAVNGGEIEGCDHCKILRYYKKRWWKETESDEYEEEEEEVCGKWTEDKKEQWDDKGVKCWQCDNCDGWQDWGCDC